MPRSLRKTSLWILKAASGLTLAYVLAVAGRELLNYGLFSFMFVLLSVTAAFFYLVKGFRLAGILTVDTCLVAMAVSLRWYVVLAYGA